MKSKFKVVDIPNYPTYSRSIQLLQNLIELPPGKAALFDSSKEINIDSMRTTAAKRGFTLHRRTASGQIFLWLEKREDAGPVEVVRQRRVWSAR